MTTKPYHIKKRLCRKCHRKHYRFRPCISPS